MSKKKLAAAFRQMFSGTPNTSLNDELFDGSCAAFKDLVANAKIYFEYGCGTSTLYVNNHTDCTIYAADTSIDWVNTTLQCATNKSRMHVKHIDLGNIGEWGRPRGYSRAEFFSDYTDHLWREGISPDVVLIDGRFRVCCFLTSLERVSAFQIQGSQIGCDVIPWP